MKESEARSCRVTMNTSYSRSSMVATAIALYARQMGLVTALCTTDMWWATRTNHHEWGRVTSEMVILTYGFIFYVHCPSLLNLLLIMQPSNCRTQSCRDKVIGVVGKKWHKIQSKSHIWANLKEGGVTWRCCLIVSTKNLLRSEDHVLCTLVIVSMKNKRWCKEWNDLNMVSPHVYGVIAVNVNKDLYLKARACGFSLMGIVTYSKLM